MMCLPTVEGSRLGTNTRSIHQGRHLDLTREHIELQMEQVMRQSEGMNWGQEQFAQKLTEIMGNEREFLKEGIRALNKHTRPNAIPLNLNG